MKKAILGALLMPLMVLAQNNLLDSSTWTVGTGSAPGFPKYGAISENVREMDANPFGDQAIIWKGIPITLSSSGGWLSDTFPIDHTKTYRFTVWMKKQNATTGSEVFGTEAYDVNGDDTVRNLSGSVNANPIFEAGDVPNLNQWYLYVGFVHNSSYTGTTSIGGVYDPATGNKVLDALDFKFSTNSVTAKHRAYYWNGENSADVLSFYDPTVYIVDGSEPTISELLNPSGGSDTQAPSAPTLTSTGHTGTTVDLFWSGAMDNVGVTGYKIFKDGVLEVTLNNFNTYQVTGLTANTTYGFTITALDAAGNESAQSTAVSVTTDSGSGGGGSGSSVWSESNSVASYNGDVAIGTTTVPADYKMAIDGKLITEEVKVQLSGNWPDYVFKDGYDLPTLEEIQKHIQEKGHLPNIPSAMEVGSNGFELGEMDRLLLEKIEELTLYIIQLERRINGLEKNQSKN
ncbi:MAG: hypothetical protein AB3N18_09795 [Allomuricauda sp.]